MGGHPAGWMGPGPRWLGVVLIVAAVAVGAASAAEVTGEARVGFYSRYFWRGQLLSEGVVLQPEASVDVSGWYAGVWANLEPASGDTNEIDFMFGRAWAWRGLQLEAGYIIYWIANYSSTQEVFVSVGRDGWVSPKVTVYYDFDEGDGAFVQGTLERVWPLSHGVELATGANVGFNIQHKVMGPGADAEAFTQFYNLELYSALSVPLNERFSLGGQIGYSIPLTEVSKAALRGINWDGEADVLWGGVTLTCSF